MNKKHLVIGGLALAAVGLVLYSRSDAGAKSKSTVVKKVRSYLPASVLTKSAAAPATVAVNEETPAVRASDTDIA